MIEYKFFIYHKVCIYVVHSVVLYISHSSMSYHMHLTHLHSRYTTLQHTAFQVLVHILIIYASVYMHVDVQVFNLGWIEIEAPSHPTINHQYATLMSPNQDEQLSVALLSLLDDWDYTIGCTLFINLD